MDRLLPWLRRSGWAYVIAAIALALAAWRLGAGGGGGQPGSASAAPTAARVERAPAAARALVHVAGEVRRPGVYRVPDGARVLAAVERAGGPTADADLTRLNLAAPLQDGQQVVVPARAAPGVAASAAAASGPVSLSSATAEQLEALDGIGPALAARIVEWRTAHGGFASVDQLAEVSGIGPGRLEALRDQVVP